MTGMYRGLDKGPIVGAHGTTLGLKGPQYIANIISSKLVLKHDIKGATVCTMDSRANFRVDIGFCVRIVF